MNREKDIANWNKQLQSCSAEEIIKFAVSKFGNKLALASSMGAEDQVLTHLLYKVDSKIPIFTLDTGRLFPETYDLISKTNARYHTKIKIYFPKTSDLEEMTNTYGVNMFYESVEKRKLCCQIRKLEPLSRAFKGLDAWICGLRSEQSVTRSDIKIIEWDESNQLIKFNPLANWIEKELWDYIEQNKIPYNPLHKKNYPSIGCQPCTRAISEGEDIRAGRWWWENPETKECGLHSKIK